MAIDFPNSPTNGQTFTGPNGLIWAYDGTKWINGTLAGNVYAPIRDPVFLGNPQAPNPPAGDADTSVATTSFVAAAVGTALNDVGRSIIHNGLFRVQQRGSGPWSTSGAYTADRWSQAFSGGTITSSVQALSDANRAAIGDEQAAWGMQCVVAGAAGAGSFTVLTQGIESTRRLAGKTVTVSFWAWAGSGAPKLGVGWNQTFGTGGSPSATVVPNGQAVTLSTAPVRYSLTFTMPSVAGKTFGTNLDDKTSMLFWLSGATDQNVASGSVGVQSATFVLWGVQLEIGSVATPLERLDPRMDLANCQRFYQVATCSARFIATATSQTVSHTVMWQPMRATPTATFVSGGSSALVNSLSLSPSAANCGYFSLVSGGGGDCFAINQIYTLSADL